MIEKASTPPTTWSDTPGRRKRRNLQPAKAAIQRVARKGAERSARSSKAYSAKKSP
jgi:hypothetical protein